jgi:iron complex outermembrane receptor protein
LADRVPSFVIVNLMTGYEHALGRTRFGAQVNINNLLNRTYFTAVNPSQAMPGAPFSIIPALQITF